MSAAVWVSAGAAVVSSASAAWSWWKANLSRKAREDAELARDAARDELAAMQTIAEAVHRAFPKPLPFDFTIEYMQRGQFRLRNVGSESVSNVRFVEPPEELRGTFFPEPRWVNAGVVNLAPKKWADFTATAMSPAFGRWDTVHPKTVEVVCDEHTDPIEVEVPLARKQ